MSFIWTWQIIADIEVKLPGERDTMQGCDFNVKFRKYNVLTDVAMTQHKRLQLMQNRCLRVSLRLQMRYPVTQLHIDTAIDYLAVRFDLQLVLLLYKDIYGGSHSPEELGLLFAKPVECDRITRSTNTGLLMYPQSNTVAYRKSSLYRGIDLWNNLNVSCRQAPDKNSFRSKALAKIKAIQEAKMLRL